MIGYHDLDRYRRGYFIPLPLAKVGYLDPRISDNHTYLPWVVTHSIKDSCFQAHIRKFLAQVQGTLRILDKGCQLIVLYSLNNH